MPRKRRRAKRGPEELERRVWSGIFDTGYDFFDELPEIWELKAFAREHLRKCMRNRLYTHRSITIG